MMMWMQTVAMGIWQQIVDLLSLIDKSPNVLHILINLMLVIITGFYALITFRISKANRQVVVLMNEQLIALDRPYIEVSTFLRPRSVIVYLRIKNTGKSSARNLRLKIDKDFYKYGRQAEDNNLSNLYLFNHVIETLPSGAMFVIPLAQSFVIFGKNAKSEVTPPVFSIHTTYSYHEKTFSETTVIDLYLYHETNVPHSEPVVDKLDEVVKILGRLSGSVQAISEELRSGHEGEEETEC